MLLIFDCDGVLLDSMLLHNEVEADVYREQGIEIAPQELGRRFAGVPLCEEFKILERETGCKLSPLLEIEMAQRKRLVFADRLKTMPGIDDVLDTLKDIPRCIASGTRLDELIHALDIVNLHDLFAPHVFSSEMVARGKPFPDLFLYAAEVMGHLPKDCLVIEDGEAGVKAAQAAGMRVLGFVGGGHCDSDHGERLKSAGASLVFSDMHELPGLIS
jgi:HAD superfamily hydrolase (TIGR01509 family)